MQHMSYPLYNINMNLEKDLLHYSMLYILGSGGKGWN